MFEFDTSFWTYKPFLLMLLLLQNSSLSVIIKASDKNYIKSTVVFLNEIVKLVICLGLLFYKQNSENFQEFFALMKDKDSLLYLIPSVCYAIQNYLVLLSLTYIDAGLYQVLSNGKIITTAIFSVILLGKQLHRLQWMALVLLTTGVTISERSSSHHQTLNSEESVADIRTGVVLMLALISLSGFAGVFTEKMLKNSKMNSSLLSKNIMLYFWGSVVNGILLIVNDAQSILEEGFFKGYTSSTLFIVFLMSFGGLIVAAVITYLDNIAKVYVTCLAIFLTSFLSFIFLNQTYDLDFVLGLIIVSVSIFLYNDPIIQQIRNQNV